MQGTLTLGELLLILLGIAVVGGLGYYWWTHRGGGAGNGGGGGGGGVGWGEQGDCNIGEHHSHMTLQECHDLGGSSFTPDNPNLPRVDPATRQPLP
jgi:hypothetical protein